ncbi:alpha/beta fold hydrolase [Gordonia sp. CPCC 206044]|uniref:alpha/beta fold hydrolase n=1 Tax=Gordonia sp. CPCC 206044 TaxID=3140793 RepID=UPI003AF3426E
MLIPGGGATGASWWRVAHELPGRTVIAVDIVGDAGRSAYRGRRLTSADELHDWLDDVLEALDVTALDLVGHSYGGWIAASYALARPGRVRRLSLVSPSMCFSSMSVPYVLRAMPVLVRRTESGARRLIDWETRGDLPVSVDVYASGVAASVAGDRPTQATAHRRVPLADGRRGDTRDGRGRPQPEQPDVRGSCPTRGGGSRRRRDRRHLPPQHHREGCGGDRRDGHGRG